MRMKRVWLLVALLVLGVGTVVAQDRRPRLIVLLMVDQFREDYVDRFQSHWTGGLHRLLVEGAWFRQADYPYFNTLTCSGHATVTTGTYPSVHGMIANEWFDREAGMAQRCTSDESSRLISYGTGLDGAGKSAAHMRVSTLADELRAQLNPGARVAAFSHKARSAVTLAGQGADAIAWLDDRGGTWTTSSAYSAEVVPAVADFVRRHPFENDFGKTWERSLPREAYLFEDPAIGIKPMEMSVTFPHELRGHGNDPDRLSYLRWLHSPFADEYVGRMALHVVQQLEFGKTTSTDFLALGFSALDRIGHEFGPDSHEVQDALIRLDQTLGELFRSLDSLVGQGSYVVALSSDHGVAPVPERARALDLDAGRIAQQELLDAVNRALIAALGPGARARALFNNDVYVDPGVAARLEDDEQAVVTIRNQLAMVPGVRAVYMREEIEANQFDHDLIGQRIAQSYDPERSGDLTIVLKPYWIVDYATTTHGSGYDYDTRVPLFMMGKGIVPGEYLERVSPADIAPTLAFMAGVTLPHAQGRVLTEALK